jgi:hypothetical protein
MRISGSQRSRRVVTNACNEEFDKELTSIVERAVENVAEKVDMVLKGRSLQGGQENKPSVSSASRNARL